MEIVWSDNVGQYVPTYCGKVGRWACFTISWDTQRSQGAKTPSWRLGCSLPGIKEDLGLFELDTAKTKADGVLALWLKGLGK